MMNTKETKTIKYPHDSLLKIETERKEFIKRYKLHDTLKKVVFGVCFVGMVVFLIFGNKMGNQNIIPFLQLGIPLICLAAMLVYGIVVRKLMDNKMRQFFNTYYKGIADYVLGSKDITDVCLSVPGKVTKEEFSENQIYKNIFEVGSRGKTDFKYKKIQMYVADCAAQVKGEKRVYPVFVGKYLECASKHKEKEPTIVYLKGEGTVLPPTNIDDKKVVLENDKMVIYSNSKNWKKVISPKAMKKIQEIKTNKLLVDLTISVHHEKVYVCMGYDDPIMVPPFMNEFDPKDNIQYKGELAKVLEVMEELN